MCGKKIIYPRLGALLRVPFREVNKVEIEFAPFGHL